MWNTQGYRVQRFGPLSKQIRVTDRGVIALAEGCTSMRVLSLGGCRKVTVSSARCETFATKFSPYLYRRLWLNICEQQPQGQNSTLTSYHGLAGQVAYLLFLHWHEYVLKTGLSPSYFERLHKWIVSFLQELFAHWKFASTEGSFQHIPSRSP